MLLHYVVKFIDLIVLTRSSQLPGFLRYHLYVAGICCLCALISVNFLNFLLSPVR